MQRRGEKVTIDNSALVGAGHSNFCVGHLTRTCERQQEGGANLILEAESQAAETDQMRAFILIRVGNQDRDYVNKKNAGGFLIWLKLFT